VDFTIRNLPTPVLEELNRAARLNGRSVNEEAIARLEGPISPHPLFDPVLRRQVEERAAETLASRPPIEETLARIRKLRERYKLPLLTQEFLDEAKSEGRR
jgi:hypothetical protein